MSRQRLLDVIIVGLKKGSFNVKTKAPISIFSVSFISGQMPLAGTQSELFVKVDIKYHTCVSIYDASNSLSGTTSS